MAFHASAKDFLLAVRERYLALQAYSDRGHVTSYPTPPDRASHREIQRIPGLPASAKRNFEEACRAHRDLCRRLRGKPLSETSFETAFLRPDRFRFAWSSPHPYPPLRHRKMTCVIGTDAQGPYHHLCAYGGEKRIERDLSLSDAVAAATGVSQGAAYTIGALLFEACGGSQLLQLRRPRFRGERVIDGVRCIAVSGLDVQGQRVTAWFGIDDLLLRRLRWKRGRSEELRLDIRTEGLDPAIRFEAPPI